MRYTHSMETAVTDLIERLEAAAEGLWEIIGEITAMTHAFWINAACRNVRSTTAHGAQRFHPGRRRSWAAKHRDVIWVALVVALIIGGGAA